MRACHMTEPRMIFDLEALLSAYGPEGDANECFQIGHVCSFICYLKSVTLLFCDRPRFRTVSFCHRPSPLPVQTIEAGEHRRQPSAIDCLAENSPACKT